MGKKTGLPDRWLDYKPVNRAIFRFIPFKVPLKRTLCSNLPPNEQFDWPRLISDLERKDLQLGLVIDLCNTNRYYDPVDIEKASSNKILHFKIYCQGHDQTPSKKDFNNFASQVKEFLRHSSDNLYIGVHCTHGVNRTGYLICKFLILFEGWEPAVAVKSFITARGHEFDKKFYVKDLMGLVPNKRETPPRYSPGPPPSASMLHQHKFFSDSETDDDNGHGAQNQSVIERRGVQYEDCRRFTSSRNTYSPDRSSGGGYGGEGTSGERKQPSQYSRNDDRSEYARYSNVNRGRGLSPETKRPIHETEMRSRKRSDNRDDMNYGKSERFVPSRKESSMDYERAPVFSSRNERPSPHFTQRDRERVTGFQGKERFSSRREDLNIPKDHFPPRRGEEKDERMDRRGGRLSPGSQQEEQFKRRGPRSPRRDQFSDRPSNQDSRSPFSSRPSPLMVDHPGDQYRKRAPLLQDPPVPRSGSDTRHFHDDRRSPFASNKPPPSKYSRLSKSPRNDYRHSRGEERQREPNVDLPRHSNPAFIMSRNDRSDTVRGSNFSLDYGSASRKSAPLLSPGNGSFERREERFSDYKYSKFRDDLGEVPHAAYSQSAKPRDRYESGRDYSPPQRSKMVSNIGRERGSGGILSHPPPSRSSYSPLRSQVIVNDRKSSPVSRNDSFSNRSAGGYKTGKTASGIPFSVPAETMSNKLRISDYQSQSVLSPPSSPPRHYRSVDKAAERTERAYDQETGLGFRDTRENLHRRSGDSRERDNDRSPDGITGRFDRESGSMRGSSSIRSFRSRVGRFVTERRGGGPPRIRGSQRGGSGHPRATSRGGTSRGGPGSFRSSSFRGSASRGGRGLISINAREKLAAGDGRHRQSLGPGRGGGGGFSTNNARRFPRSRARPMRGGLSR